MSIRTRSPVPVLRGRSPMGRSPRGRSPRSIRDGSPGQGIPSVRRERRGSFGGSSCGDRRKRGSSVSPTPRGHSPRPYGRNTAYGGETECVKVILRVRPFNEMEERQQNCLPTVVPVECEEGEEITGVNLIERRGQYVDDYYDQETDCRNSFQFDKVFFPSDIHAPPLSVQQDEQLQIYNAIGATCLDNLFDSYNSCVFAYGQTGSGKTHTMMGAHDAEGFIPKFCRDLLQRYEALPDSGREAISLEASFIEIYCEQLYDLMTVQETKTQQTWGRKQVDNYECRKKLALRQHPIMGVTVAGALTFQVKSWEDVEAILNQGLMARSTASTRMNDQSSRSHAMFQLSLSIKVPGKKTTASNGWTTREEKGTLSSASVRFVDLAGSENLKKSGSDGARMHESIHINTSLLTLRRVIDQLLEKAPVPAYRDSKLTRLLSDCLGGNSKTWFLACISPSQFNVEETKNTLRYAAKATRIVNHVSRNIDVGAKISEDLVHLKEELANAKGQQFEELQSIISTYEKTKRDMEDDINAFRLKQEETEKALALAEERAALAELRAQEAKEHATAAAQKKGSLEQKLNQAKQEILLSQKQLQEESSKTVVAEVEAKKQREINHRKEQEVKTLNARIQEQQLKVAMEREKEKKVWEEVTTQMENELAERQASWKEKDEVTQKIHEQEVDKLKDGLSQVYTKRFNLTAADYEARIQDLELLAQEYSEKNHDLEGELIKQRVQHAAAIAAADQKLEAAKQSFGQEQDNIRKARDNDKYQLASDVHNIRLELENEVGNRRSQGVPG
eukprot:TRINITY_DN738_c0_g1_i5.p1 TRINITY_DN738_c0_g1~~TRINITY_DN738_c0_g1_i5.p1  ORF type:complete len:791 (+),score=203.75 TRINITY_DN738_c0_g1_i5:60-2432(+)